MSATFTSEGAIPHMLMQYDGGTFLAPVKMTYQIGRAWNSDKQIHLQAPLRRDGRLVFALPGGGEVLA